MRTGAVHRVIAATLLGVAGAACAQYASNGYRIHPFASAIKGTERNCQGRDGNDPKNPPNAMLANINTGLRGAGGTNGSFVIKNGNCADRVAASSPCTISMQFRSCSIGNRSGTLTINCNGGAMSVALSGIGQAANAADGKGGGGVLSLAGVPLLGLVVAGRARRG